MSYCNSEIPPGTRNSAVHRRLDALVVCTFQDVHKGGRVPLPSPVLRRHLHCVQDFGDPPVAIALGAKRKHLLNGRGFALVRDHLDELTLRREIVAAIDRLGREAK